MDRGSEDDREDDVDTHQVRRGNRIWSVVRRYEDGVWRPVGTDGDWDHVQNELADWRRDLGESADEQLRLAWRMKPVWYFDGTMVGEIVDWDD